MLEDFHRKKGLCRGSICNLLDLEGIEQGL
jgi:hypothetical protein